jgi:hypothetical protein
MPYSTHNTDPKEVFLTYDLLHECISPEIDFQAPVTLSLSEILAIWFDRESHNPFGGTTQTVQVETQSISEPPTKKRKNDQHYAIVS